MTIRPYEPTDRAACLALFESNVPQYFLLSERGEFEAFLDALPGPYFVLERMGELVGCGGYAVEEQEGRADLCWGMVQGDLHGQGLGRSLTARRIEAALAHPGVTEIVLRTSQLTTGFYESLGFAVTAVEPNGFGPGLDRCEMRFSTQTR